MPAQRRIAFHVSEVEVDDEGADISRARLVTDAMDLLTRTDEVEVDDDDEGNRTQKLAASSASELRQVLGPLHPGQRHAHMTIT